MKKEELLKVYRTMKTIRSFEERCDKEFMQGNIPGFVHLYAGQEAVAVGICSHLSDEDKIGSTHRGHGHCIAKGCDITDMMKELYGKKDGICGGKGGSMHIADLSKGMLGANGIVGGGPPIVLGAALTYKTKKTNNVSIGFFGDGASNQGSISESMNMATVLNLPAIFVCEDNGYAESTARDYAVGGNIVDRGKAFGLDSHEVDGDNFFEVYDTAKEVIENARNGKGPALIHIRTSKVYGHFEGDAISYRTKEENERIKNDEDPLKIFKKKVTESGLLELSQLETLENEAKEKVKIAIEQSKNAEFPSEKDLLTDVYVKY